MPWLRREDDENGDRLLLVHVPRCGGTSLVKEYKVLQNARKRQNCYHKCGLTYFFYRYALLEKRNFPVWTYENLYAITVIIVGFIVWLAIPEWDVEACAGQSLCPPPVSISFWTMGAFTFFLNTFIMAAAIMGRTDWMRRLTMWIFGYILFEFSSTLEFLHGISYYGYLMHFTANKMIKYKLATEEDIRSNSFAIIRNPYSRMLSIYMYNRYGPLESFDHFVKAWYVKWKRYQASGSTEERDVYCHVLPMFEYTHIDGVQAVNNIIRQEDLSALTSTTESEELDAVRSKYSHLSEEVRIALKRMPHANRRPLKKKMDWMDYYSQETMDIVLEMFWEDFGVFGYDTRIPKRKDLVPKFDEKSPPRKTSINSTFPHAYNPSRTNSGGSEDCNSSASDSITDEESPIGQGEDFVVSIDGEYPEQEEISPAPRSEEAENNNLSNFTSVTVV